MPSTTASQNSPDQNSNPQNLILAALPPADFQRLAPYLCEVFLPLGQVLYEPLEPIEVVYFPICAMISLVSIMEDGSTVETGIIGGDGILGHPAYLESQYMPSRALVQISGTAVKLDAATLKSEFNRNGALQKLLLRYTQAFLSQVSQTAACNRFHPTEERLARWLLQSHDFARTDTLGLTQDFLSSMLGTRRASVTVAATALQQAGIIHYNRGKITILNREALEAASCECYRVVRSEYDRLLDRA